MKRVVASLLAVALLFSNVTTAYAVELDEFQQIEVTTETEVATSETEEKTQEEVPMTEQSEVDVEIDTESDSEIEEGLETEENSEVDEDIEIESNSKIEEGLSTEEDLGMETDSEITEESNSETKEKPEEISEKTESVVDDTLENEEVSEEIEQPEVEVPLSIEYLVVDTPVIQATEESHVFVGLSNSNLDVSKLKLQVVDEYGNLLLFDASADTEDGVLFSKSMDINGTYTLKALQYEGQVIDFAVIGINAGFGVGEETETNPDAVVDETEENVSTEIWTAEGDVIEEQDSLEDALVNSAGVQTLSEDDELVIVLDPGHDDTHAGARGNGLEEENLNLKIALYCKEVLDKYPSAKVYLTRSSDACPYPGTTSGGCNENRVLQAKNLGADIYISFHLNSSTNTAAQGAEVYYPNSNYNPNISNEGYDLAAEVLDNLIALGLVDRGAKIRNSETSNTYPDGSLADYYAVIRNSKLNGFPGIIIEHAFLSNASDAANYLNTEEKLKALGVADANAIIDVYGLETYEDYEKGSAVFSTGYDANGKLEIKVNEIPNVYGVQLAVWSESNGQDDLKWYTATKNAEVWSAKVDISKHNTIGTYQVHAYAQKTDGSQYLIGNTTFKVNKSSVDKLEVKNVNETNGIFDIVLSGIYAEAGVQNIQVPVWTTKNQSDIKWYTATKQTDGTYKVTVDIVNHNYTYGTYQIHVYLTEKNGVKTQVKTFTYTLGQPSLRVEKSLSTNETSCTVQIYNVPNSKDISNVQFAVWSAANGQDDLKWYTGSKQSTGSWKVNISNKNHSGTGIYYVHVYAYTKNGSAEKIGSTSYSLTKPTADKPVVKNANATNGTFDIVVSNVSAKAGVSKVEVPVWTQKDQSDICWYTATKQSDGTYLVHVNVANHKYNYGTFEMHTYVTDGNGNRSYVAKEIYEIKCPVTSVSVSLNQTETTVTAIAKNVPYASSISKVQFAVWSTSNGQDDLVWHNATKQSDGSWKASISVSQHKGFGNHNVHVYVQLKNGQKVLVGNKTYSISKPTASVPEVESVNAQAGTFNVRIKNIVSKSGVLKVEVPVWTQKDQSDIKWYTAVKQSDGTYLLGVNIANHKYNYGNFNIHVYVTDGNGNKTIVSNSKYTMNAPKTAAKVVLDNTESNATITADKLPYGNGISKVQVAVWSTSGGQDDLKWYDMKRQSDGSWKYVVPTSNHKTAGTYYAHVYVQTKDGSMHNVAQATYKIQSITVSNISTSNVDETNGTFTININGLSVPSGIKNIRVPVWCANDQSDIVWYDATKISDGSYKVYVDIRNHKSNLGTYKVHVYAYANNGLSKVVGSTSCKVLTCSSTYYNIMGSSAISVNQMVAYYNAKAVYPAFYSSSDAPTIQAFCQMYYDECKAEGVKVEVAFCQAMKETGFLKFGGDVSITQYNFAGIGATGNGNPGNSFSSVCEGIRAQVQHLKAYASTESLNNACVDPRFKYVTRGSAPYVEWLGKQENPNGVGWATGKNYGYSIKNDYIARMLQY